MSSHRMPNWTRCLSTSIRRPRGRRTTRARYATTRLFAPARALGRQNARALHNAGASARTWSTGTPTVKTCSAARTAALMSKSVIAAVAASTDVAGAYTNLQIDWQTPQRGNRRNRHHYADNRHLVHSTLRLEFKRRNVRQSGTHGSLSFGSLVLVLFSVPTRLHWMGVGKHSVHRAYFSVVQCPLGSASARDVVFCIQ